MPLTDEEKGMLNKLEGLLTGLLESGKGSVSDKEFGLLSVVPQKGAQSDKSRTMNYNTSGQAESYPLEGNTMMTDPRDVQHFISTLPPAMQMRIEEIRDAVSDVEFQNFIRKMMSGSVPEGAIFEALPHTQQTNLGFPQMAGLGDKSHTWMDDPFGGYYDEYEGWPRRPDIGGFGTYEERFKQRGGQGGWYPTKKKTYQYPSPRTLDFS